ncbi:protein-methionine-sulfoxide reductase heme-binding subunit MsrQ [Formosimonas limnophila]|uniref:Protein-methionine-sulfoxide reductase heme-binding subunit MsrQ n=1 Tax=Formosimonas limnophila TaxID=1384487 RepID=A0A8J3CHK1_9BURK|nr:protein-methionine-sulfoxide reductase heme-binding subunit MsrQ [Formosimonas limnophila]GHA74465.1 protein-methionine-sulfoxide reductase heme-binding subunit MsrQ [Formosimonas limnophila]
MKPTASDIQFYKTLIFFNALIPLLIMLWDFAHGQIGVNPVELSIRTFGVLTLIFLLLTLCVTPMRKLFGWGFLIKYRRMLGLFAFFYGCLHLLTYMGFDRSWSISGTVADVIKRPFIAVGMVSFLLLIPLAVTSADKMLRRIGAKRWLKLHKLIYLIAIGGVVHFYMIVKSDVFWPVVFAVALSVLFGYRIYSAYQKARG